MQTIRHVAVEHVELEILLVEAEAGMKARMGGGDKYEVVYEENYDYVQNALGQRSTEGVDRFLSAHVKNVWDLGNEIRGRILSGVAGSFELVRNNPAAMVALVEAVEVYEHAAEEYSALCDGTNKQEDGRSLRFTDMRAAALTQIYQDFEWRALEVFRTIHMQNEDMGDEEISQTTNNTKSTMEAAQFTAVLNAANKLVADIDLVQTEMAPCFAPHWTVDVLWSSCVAHICSNQILNQVGGPEGTNLEKLTVTQLLELVAWIEFFRLHMEQMFPQITDLRSSNKTYFDTRPDLFTTNRKQVDMDSAIDALAWVNNLLDDIHRLAQEEFLQRIRDQMSQWLDNVYRGPHSQYRASNGRLTTSLCEDVFSLVTVQLRTVQTRLSPSSHALAVAATLVLNNVRRKQLEERQKFLSTLEASCAAANDFARMSERCEEVVRDLVRECNFGEDGRALLEASSSELLALFGTDAVYAAQHTHTFVFAPIREDAIAHQLFSKEWEDTLTNNDCVLVLVRTLDDFLADLDVFLDTFLVKKVMDGLVMSSAVFYLECLLTATQQHKDGMFSSIKRAMDRITGDLDTMENYFHRQAQEHPTLSRTVEAHFAILHAVKDIMALAGDISQEDGRRAVLILHKAVDDCHLTQRMVGDLWRAAGGGADAPLELLNSLREDMLMMSPEKSKEDKRRIQERRTRMAMSLEERRVVVGLSAKHMIANFYEERDKNMENAASQGVFGAFFN